MNSVPSYTIDRETAATLREWLFENAVEKHGEPEISETLADLAAAIDGVLYEERRPSNLVRGHRRFHRVTEPRHTSTVT